MNQVTYFYGTGRRKNAIARVKLVPGNGAVLINGKALTDVVTRLTLQNVITQPLKVTQTMGQFNVQAAVLGGGVAANKALRGALEAACTERRLKFHAAKMAYCTDNAAMIAALGYHQLQAGEIAGLDVDAYASAT